MLDNEINIERRKEGRLASRIRLILFNKVNFSLYWLLRHVEGGERILSVHSLFRPFRKLHENDMTSLWTNMESVSLHGLVCGGIHNRE